MAIATKAFVLGSIEYTITQLPTSDGIPIYSRLMKSLGPVAREVLANSEVRALIQAASVSPDNQTTEVTAARNAAAGKLGLQFASLLVQAIEQLPTDFLLELARTFAGVSKFASKDTGGVPIELSDKSAFDQHFAGRYMQLTRWIIENIKFNFSDFLAGLLASVARAQAG